MNGWEDHAGTAVCLLTKNIDTDQIIPARFMSQPRADGYENFLLHDVRRLQDGSLDPQFTLNQYPDASVLIAGHNFGSGSSREAAVYALVDSGIRAVVASGFGDIFAANAINNGLLPALVSQQDIDQLAHMISDDAVQCNINLKHQSIGIDNKTFSFNIDSVWLTKLVNGWDDIDLTKTHEQSITQFKLQRQTNAAWSWPVTANDAHSSAHKT